jgi:hypothetical protein
MYLQRSVLRCLWAIFVLAPLLQAQESKWQNLAQLRPGTRIQVVENSLKSTSGRFVRFSETDLTLKVEEKEVVVPRDQIHRVSVSGKNRKRNVLFGLAAGAASGVIVAVASPELGTGKCSPGASCVDSAVVTGLGLAGAGVGSAIGAVLPADKTVYKAQLPEQTGGKK